MRSRWHRFVEYLLPWYDPKAEQVRDQRTATIRRNAIAARIKAEHVREAYRQTAERVQR